jgi:hypothetical protein
MTDADKKLYDKAIDDLLSIASGTPEEIDAMTTPWIAGYKKGIEEMKIVACEFAVLKKTILKLRNCMNCKHRDTRCFSSGEDKGVVLCNHWEMKE